MTHFAACSLSAAFGDWYNSPAKNAIPNPGWITSSIATMRIRWAASCSLILTA